MRTSNMRILGIHVKPSDIYIDSLSQILSLDDQKIIIRSTIHSLRIPINLISNSSTKR